MKGHSKVLIKMLLKINSEKKKETKMLIYQNVKQMMSNCQTQAVVDELLEFSSDDTSRVREDVMNLTTFGLITFPSSDLELDTISQTAALGLADSKRRVREAALECLAVTGQCLGGQRIQLLLDFVRHLDRKERLNGEMVGAVRTRLGRKSLPRVSPEGLLVGGLEPGQEGADLHWALKGSGPGSQLSGTLLDLHAQRRSRADSGAGVKPRTPSLPPMGSKSEQGQALKIRSSRDENDYKEPFY